MSVSPVTTLQEICVKLGTLPVYTNILSVTGNHQNQFITKISWKNYSTEGTGNNKKEAKQNAAKMMLLLLLSSNEIPKQILSSFSTLQADFKLNSSAITNDIRSTNLSDSNTNKFINSIGLLNEYCQKHNLSAPVYEDVTMSGPSHLPTFTVSCAVGSVRQEGCASTKQVAKHESAKKVLEDLKNKSCVSVDNLNVEFMKVLSHQPSYDKSMEQKVVQIYGQVRKKPVLFRPLIKINDYLTILRDLCYNISIENKNSLKKAFNTSVFTDSNTLKVIIYKALNTTMEETSFNTINHNFLIGLKLHTHPVIFQFGIGTTIEQARQNALHKLLEYIFLLLQ